MSPGRPSKKGETEQLKASVSPMLKKGIEHLVQFVSPHHTWNTLAVQWLDERLMVEFGAKTALELKAIINGLEDSEADSLIPFELLEGVDPLTFSAIAKDVAESSPGQANMKLIPLAILQRHVDPEVLSEALIRHSALSQSNSTEQTNDNHRNNH